MGSLGYSCPANTAITILLAIAARPLSSPFRLSPDAHCRPRRRKARFAHASAQLINAADQTWYLVRRQNRAIINIPATFAAVVSGGAGHGAYIAARVLFPFAMLLTRLGGEIGPVVIAVGLLQFPIYGLLVGRAVALQTATPFVLLTTALLFAVLICFSVLLPGFS